jgi:hypothetical protein
MSCQPIAGYEREMFSAGCTMNIGSKKLLREVASTFCGAQVLIVGSVMLYLCGSICAPRGSRNFVWVRFTCVCEAPDQILGGHIQL